ncbi:carboxypeptidase regulatory-like domain-containing protein [Candidatus Daviesbacteria bacterium]|nr:carboxypeptidase regulatory-like domain-containing protein [Candidatus Daviesbacteria bacterium]
MLPLIFFLVVFFLRLLAPPLAVGAVSSCTASVTPTSVNTNTDSSFTFTLNNTSSQTIVWMKVTRPSSNFTLGGFSIGGWNVSSSDEARTFTGGSLSNGGNIVFTISATSGSSEASSANWTVQASDDSGGASPTTCTGTLGTAISGAGADTTAPTISNIVISEVSDTVAKISWTTDESANSTLLYGKTTDYGGTKTDSSRVTSHAFTIDALSANTTYHFNVKSADASGNKSESGDQTFATAKAGTTTTTTTTVTKSVTATPKPDTSVPRVTLDLDFEKAYTEPPKISGKATDSDAGGDKGGINSIEFSIDDGKSWLPVDNVTGIGSKSTTFDFIPPIFEDGNYQIKVRAKDLTGNTTVTTSKTLIVDRLPPTVGGVLFSIGPQIISPTPEGYIIALVGLSQKITLSEVGGPIEVKVERGKGKGESQELTSLTKNLDNGLWSGELNFTEPGIHELTVNSVDGADNKTSKKINTVLVLENGQVKDKGGQQIKNVKVSLYYFEPTSQRFILWDGAPFEQQNPQSLGEDGSYKLLLPAGKYYLKIAAPGYKGLKTEIFTISQTQPVNQDFTLEKAQGFQIGPFFLYWPSLQSTSVNLKLSHPSLPPLLDNFAGQELPFLEFPNSELNTNQFKGKATILTLSSIWSPQTAEVLTILDSLVSKEINVVSVMVQETASKVDIFNKRGNYQIPVLADPDGVLTTELGVLNLPTHLFLDRKGIIKKVRVGVLKRQELLDNLVN